MSSTHKSPETHIFGTSHRKQLIGGLFVFRMTFLEKNGPPFWKLAVTLSETEHGRQKMTHLFGLLNLASELPCKLLKFRKLYESSSNDETITEVRPNNKSSIF